MKNNKKESSDEFFTSMGKRMDQFLTELSDANIRLQKEFEEKTESLKRSRDLLRKEIKNKKRWAEVQKSLKRAEKELENAFKEAFSKPKVKKKRTAPRKAK